MTEGDLLRIYELATHRPDRAHLTPSRIRLGHYYSNGRYGEDWSVRQIVEESADGGGEIDRITFKGVAGSGRGSTGTMTRAELARWAKHEVIRDESSWRRLGADAV